MTVPDPDGIAILIVDDRTDKLLALESVLAGLNVTIVKASSGKEALEILASRRSFAVILLDVYMPFMDGFETARQIREKLELRDIPIIFVSAVDADDRRLEQAYSLGAVDYIPTPCPAAVLRARVLVFIDLYKKTEALERSRQALEGEVQKGSVRLRESEDRWRLFVEQAREFAIFMTDPAGLISDWNPGAERILGYSEQEILGQHLSVCFTPEDRQTQVVELELRKARETGQANNERWHIRKDGSRFWASGVLVALQSDHSPLRGFAKILRDDTARKLAEEEIKKLNTELENHVTDRTAALKETNEQLENFCYTVSHDLRAPLRAMRGFSQALSEDYRDQLDEVARDYLQRIINSAGRMDSLIQDLLAYSRASRRELKIEEVSLEEVIESAQSTLFDEILKKRASFTVQRPLPRVLAHREALEQALTNLILNSLTYVKETVRPRVDISTETLGPAVRILIQDNGIGIAAEHHERIFRIFERLHFDQYPGTGVGLAIVRRSIERMGGKVGLESRLDQGSRFWIELPKALPAKEETRL